MPPLWFIACVCINLDGSGVPDISYDHGVTNLYGALVCGCLHCDVVANEDPAKLHSGLRLDELSITMVRLHGYCDLGELCSMINEPISPYGHIVLWESHL